MAGLATSAAILSAELCCRSASSWACSPSRGRSVRLANVCEVPRIFAAASAPGCAAVAMIQQTLYTVRRCGRIRIARYSVSTATCPTLDAIFSGCGSAHARMVLVFAAPFVLPGWLTSLPPDVRRRRQRRLLSAIWVFNDWWYPLASCCRRSRYCCVDGSHHLLRLRRGPCGPAIVAFSRTYSSAPHPVECSHLCDLFHVHPAKRGQGACFDLRASRHATRGPATTSLVAFRERALHHELGERQRSVLFEP